MKALFKITLSLLALFFVIAFDGCQPKKVNTEAEASLNRLKNIVDTMAMSKENGWYAGVDTAFVEVPTDPNDPSITRVDTVVTSAEESKKLGFAQSSIAGYYRSIYSNRLKEVEMYKKDMNEAMIKELKEIEEKVDNLYK